jgi:ABC-type transporter MlaC component
MNIRIRFLAALLLVALSTTAAVAPAAVGLAGIRARIDRVVALLQAPGPIGPERRRAILAEAEPAFAWREMARAAMGPQWRELTPAERAEFTRLFRTLVEDSYLSRVLHHQGEKVVYGRASVEGDAALLPTQIVRPDRGAGVKTAGKGST